MTRRRHQPIDQVSGLPDGTLADVPVWVCLRDGRLVCLRCEVTGPVDRRRLSMHARAFGRLHAACEEPKSPGLGKRLAAARRARGWSFERTAEAAGVSVPTVVAVELDGSGRVTWAARLVARALRVGV